MVHSSSLKADSCATFEVLTAEIMKIQDISDITPCPRTLGG